MNPAACRLDLASATAVVCACRRRRVATMTILLLSVCSPAMGTNLFVSQSALDGPSQSILEFTPSGMQSTFATGLDSPGGLAFNSSGDYLKPTPIRETSMNFRRPGSGRRSLLDCRSLTV